MSDPKKEILGELKEMGFGPEEHDEISVVTAVAIVQDQKTSASDDSKSFLALMSYMRHHFRAQSTRIRRLEIAMFVIFVMAVTIYELESHGLLKLPH